jgi:hypothetical protein
MYNIVFINFLARVRKAQPRCVSSLSAQARSSATGNEGQNAQRTSAPMEYF